MVELCGKFAHPGAHVNQTRIRWSFSLCISAVARKHVQLKVMECSANYSFHVSSFAIRVPSSVSFAGWSRSSVEKNENNGQTMCKLLRRKASNDRKQFRRTFVLPFRFPFQSVQDGNMYLRRNARMNH